MKLSNCAEDQTRPLSLQNRSRCSPTTLRSKALKNAAVRRTCATKRAAAETAADDGVAGENFGVQRLGIYAEGLVKMPQFAECAR